MGSAQETGLAACALAVLLTLAGCSQRPEAGSDPAKPQAALSAPGSGGRNAASEPAIAADRSYAVSGIDHIMWGDDDGQFSRDGECDDKRFSGAGMTATPLLDSDIKHDATDCRTAFAQGRLTLKE